MHKESDVKSVETRFKKPLPGALFFLLLIFLLAFFLRLQPLMQGSLVGPDPWFHARMSELVVAEQGIPSYDSLSMQGRAYTYPMLFHVLFAFFSVFTGLPVIFLIPLLPSFYGAAAVLLVFVFSKRLFNSEKIALFSAFCIAIMPLHLIRTASYARPDSLALLLVPAIIYLFYTKRFSVACILSFCLALLHPLSSLYLCLFLLFLVLVCKVKRLSFESGKAFAIVLIIVVVWLLWLFSQPYPVSLYVSSVSLESSENSPFSLIDFFFYLPFSWLFLALGLLYSRNQLFLKAWLAFSLFYGIFSTRLILFFSVPAAIMAGYGLHWAYEKVRPHKKAFIALLLILALVAVAPRIAGQEKYVTDDEKAALLWLKQNSPDDANVACLWDRGHPVAYISGRAVVVDGYFEFAPQLQERNDSVKVIAQTSDCSKILSEAEKWRINYFFIHSAALRSQSFQSGILEANCDFMETVFENQGAKIIKFGFNRVP